MNYYKLAIATGLTHDQALRFDLAMKRKDPTNIYHLNPAK